MIDEKIILQVLAEQQEEIKNYKPQKWVTRMEESLFEFDTTMAQVVIGVRRSGKSTLCHKVLLEHGIRYAYVNLDDDRLANMKVADLNTVLSCVYQLYGTDIPYLVLDEIQEALQNVAPGAWSLLSVQYEDETNLIHYEWEFVTA